MVFNILATDAGLYEISLASSCVVYITYLKFTQIVQCWCHVSHLRLHVVFEIVFKWSDKINNLFCLILNKALGSANVFAMSW